MLKRSIFTTSTMALCLGLGLQSCRDDKDGFTLYQNDQAGLTALLEAVRTADQTTVFRFEGSQLANDRELELASGAKLVLENNDALFQRPDGTPLPCSTCSEVTIEVIEANKPADWLGWGLPAYDTNGNLLDHTPAISITATCDNQAMVLQPGRHIRMYVPHDELAGYQIAYATGSTWTLGANNAVFNSNWAIGGNNYEGYEFLVKKTGWITGIRPFAPNGSMNFCVKLPLQYNQDNTRLYALYGDSLHNVVELEAQTSDAGVFCWPNAPINGSIRFVAIAKSGPQYWFADRNSVAASDNNNLKMTPITSDEASIIAFLKGL